MTIPSLSRPMAQLLDAVAPGAVAADLYGERGSEVYDAMTQGDGSEVREVLRVGRRTRGRILELACGSGRLTVPLGRLGRETVALDNSARMLQILDGQARRAGIDTIRPVQEDMSAFALDGHFGLIVLATTSITLLAAEGRRMLLDAVRAHLAPDGVFLVAVHATGAHPTGEHTRLVPLGDGGVVLLDEHVDVEEGYRDVSVIRLHRRGEALAAEAFSSRVQLLDEAQLRAELDTAGLRVRETAPLRFAAGAPRISMIECTR